MRSTESAAPSWLACGPTVSTGEGAFRKITSAVDPRISLPSPLRPCVPITSKSIPCSSIAFARTFQSSPVLTTDSVQEKIPQRLGLDELRHILFGMVRDRNRNAVRRDAGRDRVCDPQEASAELGKQAGDRKSTRLNSSHSSISYAVFCLKKKKVRGR